MQRVQANNGLFSNCMYLKDKINEGYTEDYTSSLTAGIRMTYALSIGLSSNKDDNWFGRQIVLNVGLDCCDEYFCNAMEKC